jgi:hypothetical protein
MSPRTPEVVPGPGGPFGWFGVESRLVRLRDAIALGRILAIEERIPMTLVKYGRDPDREGRILVETVFVMTDEWFTAQRQFTNAALMRAAKYGSGRAEGRA